MIYGYRRSISWQDFMHENFVYFIPASFARVRPEDSKMYILHYLTLRLTNNRSRRILPIEVFRSHTLSNLDRRNNPGLPSIRCRNLVRTCHHMIRGIVTPCRISLGEDNFGIIVFYKTWISEEWRGGERQGWGLTNHEQKQHLREHPDIPYLCRSLSLCQCLPLSAPCFPSWVLWSRRTCANVWYHLVL